MNRNICLFIGIIFSALFLFSSCDETEGVDAYANWQQRNENYIDSIAKVAAANPTEWRKYKAWYLAPDSENDLVASKVDEYVYVNVLKEGTGTETPFYTDSVQVNYRGTLMNGELFDQSYYDDDPDPEFVTPTGFKVSGVVEGFTTALLHMKEGDRWVVYIPWKLGYGESGRSGTNIRGYSNLIFDIDLVEVISFK